MISRILTIGLGTLMLCGCAKHVNVPKWTPTQDKAVDVTLSEAATSVSKNLNTLAENEQAANPPKVVVAAPNPATYDMNILASVNWQGEIQPLLSALVKKTDYRLRVMGKAPGIPVMISINAKNEMIGNIIRDIGLQAKKRAEVVVFPSTRIVELRYMDNQ